MFFASGSLSWAGAQNARPYCWVGLLCSCFAAHYLWQDGGIGWHRMRMLVSVRNQLLQCPGVGSGEILEGV